MSEETNREKILFEYIEALDTRIKVLEEELTRSLKEKKDETFSEKEN